MENLESIRSALQSIRSALETIERGILQGQEDKQEDQRGMAPHEIGMVSSILRASGAYTHVDNPDAFLGHFLGVVQGAPQPTGPESLKAMLEAALVAYSDVSGDGAADLPAFPDSVSEAAWSLLSNSSPE